jgi:hypothetical protein
MTPHAELAAIRKRTEAGYTLPQDQAQLRADLSALVEMARTTTDIIFQIHGWCAEYNEGDIDDAFALGEITGLVEGWGEL